MSDQDFGVLLHDADDVLPLGLVGTPWDIIFKALRDVLKSGVGTSDSDFMRKACALYFLARGDLEAVTDHDVLNGIAAALLIPYWVENFEDPKQASAVLYNWIKYRPTRANLTALALASGMRAFRLREIYTSTEFGISHTFGFDLGEGYETSFFAGPNAEPGLSTAQRICGALTHFFLRIKDAPTLITDITYPSAAPSGWQYFFRANQSEIRILQGYNFDLYDSNGNLAHLPDEYAVVEPVAVRDTYGTNTAISGSTHLITLDDGQMRISWGQSPVNAYSLFANVSINIPGMLQTWPSLSHVDVNLPPNAIPGAPLFDGMDDRIFGPGWSIFAAYDSNLNRIDINDLYLAGGSDLYDPVYLRARRYLTVCSVWLSYTPPPPPPIPEDTSFIIVNEETGEVEHYISDEGMVFSQVGHIEMPDSEMITVYETGVRTESFYFTTNGRNETANTDISHVDIPVYNEDGTAPAADTPYDGSPVLAFMDVTGNTKQADGESLYADDGVLRLDAPDTDEGEQWAALVERIFTLSFANTQLPGIIITLPASETGTSGTTVTLPTMSGEYESGGKTWTPSAWDIGAFGSTYTITGDTVAHLIFEEVPSELTAYFTNQGSAGTANTSMSSSQSYQLYDASGNALSFDLTKKYTINKYYNISGTEKSVGAYAKCIDVMDNLYLRPNASPTIFRAELSLSPQTTIEAYFTANGSSETTDTYCGSTDTKTLYDASGVPIPYDSTKTYTTVASFVVNGDTAYTDFDGNFAAWSDTVLKGRGTNNYYYKIVIRVE